MTLRLNGATSGYTEIDAPAVAGNNTLLLPTGNGTSGQVLSTNGSGALSWVNRGFAIGTNKTYNWNSSTSNTFLDFENIPSWANKITLMLYAIGTTGTADLLVQVGSGSISSTGYVSTTNQISIASGTGGTSSTAGFIVRSAASTNQFYGQMILTHIGSNIWTSSHGFRSATNLTVQGGGGSDVLTGALDRVRLTTTTGTPTFNGGQANILIEG